MKLTKEMRHQGMETRNQNWIGKLTSTVSFPIQDKNRLKDKNRLRQYINIGCGRGSGDAWKTQWEQIMKNKTKEVSHLSVCGIIVGLCLHCVESITIQQERKLILKALSHWTHTYFSDSSILNAAVHTEIRIT